MNPSLPTPPTPAPGTFDLAGLMAGRPVLWTRAQGPACPVHDEAAATLSAAAIESARQRLQRFAPLLAVLFEGLQASGGQIESPLQRVPALQSTLGLPPEQGSLWVKADHLLPVAGSVKARGGTHEVIEWAEALALRHGLISPGGDYRNLASPAARALFGQYTVAVGSTGNLGLAIGTMAAALGFRAEVHMSADAKAWKKERLRSRGVNVVEHAGDYADAVAAGRAVAAADPHCHFVDDERSTSLFLGYAAAASHLATQLAEAGRAVDAEHPLFVYLPCGVGGAPGGVAYGLHQIYGPHVHCFFAEPTASPCFLVQQLAGWPGLPAAGPHPSVYDLGLDNRTEADGLAVPRASTLAAAAVGQRLAGVFTVQDATLMQQLWQAQATEGLRIEPSAAAGLSGPQRLLNTPQGQAYLDQQGLTRHMAQSTHVAWLTGGMLMPEADYQGFLQRGQASDRQDHPSP